MTTTQTATNSFRPAIHGREMKLAAEGLGYFPKDDYRNWAELAELLVRFGIGPQDMGAYR